ncbi:DNA methyltransferase, partial [Francisella tularensis subsp. holarctica]|nr:DNA methyltransferase [Francisella tularensis subsp. holarctica]
SYEDLFVSLNNGIAARNYAIDVIRYLKVSDIKDNNINNKPFYVNKYKESDLIEKGTLLLTRKGTVGYSYYLDKDGSFVASSEIFIIKL